MYISMSELWFNNFGQNLKIPTIVTRPQNGLCQHKAKDVKEDPIFSPFFYYPMHDTFPIRNIWYWISKLWILEENIDNRICNLSFKILKGIQTEIIIFWLSQVFLIWSLLQKIDKITVQSWNVPRQWFRWPLWMAQNWKN